MTELARLIETVGLATSDGPAIALVGGFAVAVRAEPRFTRDVDIAMTVGSDTEAEAIVRRFTALGFETTAIIEHEATSRLATARLRDSTGGLIDLLFASSGIEAEIVETAVPIDVLPDVRIPVATVGHLIALKLLSVADDRPTDQADLLALAAAASEPDIAEARVAVDLISARGYDRGRDLPAALDDLMGG